jgi:hypothetical protein
MGPLLRCPLSHVTEDRQVYTGLSNQLRKRNRSGYDKGAASKAELSSALGKRGHHSK